MTRTCRECRKDGAPCSMPPLADSEFCWAHDPRSRQKAQEARRKGGMSRQINQRGRSAKDAHDAAPTLRSVAAIQQVLEQAVGDALLLENSALRSRTLGYLAQIALKTLEVGDFEQRLEALEAQTQPKRRAQ